MIDEIIWFMSYSAAENVSGFISGKYDLASLGDEQSGERFEKRNRFYYYYLQLFSYQSKWFSASTYNGHLSLNIKTMMK